MLRQALELRKAGFCHAPEALDTVDVDPAPDEFILSMIDAEVAITKIDQAVDRVAVEAAQLRSLKGSQIGREEAHDLLNFPFRNAGTLGVSVFHSLTVLYRHCEEPIS